MTRNWNTALAGIIRMRVLLLLFFAFGSTMVSAQSDDEPEPPACPAGQACKQAPVPAPGSVPLDPNVILDPSFQQSTPDKFQDKMPVVKVPQDSRTPSRQEPLELTEFQQFVFASTGKALPIYGRKLFDGVPATFAPVDRIPVSADYTIGPGDELVIRAWGQVTIAIRPTVDRNGAIYIPKVGSIPVAGIQYRQLTEYLRSQIGRVFQNFDLNVTLGDLRSIQVFVVGQAQRPGSYTVSSLSTLVNAIFASGGPSSKGSMRHIQLRRGGVTVSDFDLYDLLLKGDKSKDKPLLPGDVIYFAPVGPQMAFVGSVNVPGIFELRADASLATALEMAGGLSTTAAGTKVTIERIDNRAARRVEELLLDDNGLQQPIKDGDVVRVFSLSPRFDNSITLRGHVAQPGRYPWRPNMRVRDLIPTRGFLIRREYWTTRNRLEADPPRDDSKLKSAETPLVGAKVNDPISTPEVRGVHTPEVNWEYALIERLDPETLSTRLIPFNLGRAIELGASDMDNLLLEAGDIVTIYSQSDLKTPLARQNKFVRLEGEFKAAGLYQVKQGGLREAVAAAGGLTADAYLLGAQFYRESTRIEQQRRLDSFLSQMEEDVERNVSAAARNVTSAEEAAALKDKADSQRRLIEKMRQVKADGRIVITVSPNATGIESIPDLLLEDGDRFLVPSTPATVNVIGAVYNESSQLFKRGWKAEDYLRAAGGMTRESDSKKAFVIRANGSVVGSAGSGWWSGGMSSWELMPGDTIVVPQNLNRIGFMRGLKDWTQVIGQLALGVAAVSVLRQ